MRSRYRIRDCRARAAIGCSGGYMRRWARAAPSERTAIADSPWTCASGPAGGVCSGWLAWLISGPRSGVAATGSAADDLGADGAHRPSPQVRPQHEGAERRVGADLFERAGGGDPQGVPGGGGEPEAAHQDRSQTRHGLVAAEGAEGGDGVPEAPVAPAEQ